jgi:hypothetical protein
MNEATIQAAVRLAASRQGWQLWRNNVGVLLDSRGVPVRYGLANDCKAVNANIKSADLIGIRPVVITQEMVGMTIGQFVSLECKVDISKRDQRRDAQERWMVIVNAAGGYARMTQGEL